MKPAKITKSKCVKGGISMKKMSSTKAKSVKGGATVAKKPVATPKATKEKVMKKNIIATINSLSKQLEDLKKEMK